MGFDRSASTVYKPPQRTPLTGAATGASPRTPLAGAATGRQSGRLGGRGEFDPNYAATMPAAATTALQGFAAQNFGAGPSGGGGGGAYTPVEGPNLGQLRDDEIAAAMQAIKAKFQQARGALQTDREMLKLTHQAGRAASFRGEDRAIEAAMSSMAGRGMARSGFAAQRAAGIATEAGTGRASALAQYRAERGYIQQQLKQGLPSQRSAEEAERLAAIRAAYAMHELNKP